MLRTCHFIKSVECACPIILLIYHFTWNHGGFGWFGWQLSERTKIGIKQLFGSDF